MSLAEDLDEHALVPVESLVRKPRVRAHSASMKRLSQRELSNGKQLADAQLDGMPAEAIELPATRAACEPGGSNAERPCPFVSCKWHLYLDVNPQSGAIKFNFPNLEVHELSETCALDVAERARVNDGLSGEIVGALVNITRTCVQHFEHRFTDRVRALRRAHFAESLERQVTRNPTPEIDRGIGDTRAALRAAFRRLELALRARELRKSRVRRALAVRAAKGGA